jgi:hypothetical protein
MLRAIFHRDKRTKDGLASTCLRCKYLVWQEMLADKSRAARRMKTWPKSP